MIRKTKQNASKAMSNKLDNWPVRSPNEHGYKLSDVVRLTYYTTDVQAFGKAAPVLIERLRGANCRPATSLIGVVALYHPECLVEIEAVVVR